MQGSRGLVLGLPLGLGMLRGLAVGRSAQGRDGLFCRLPERCLLLLREHRRLDLELLFHFGNVAMPPEVLEHAGGKVVQPALDSGGEHAPQLLPVGLRDAFKQADHLVRSPR